jgi:hypothetical protein
MYHDPKSQVEIRDVAAGLWIWRLEHPHWKPGQGWEPVVRAARLPFERMIVSHGEPVHTRAAYERALELAPWSGL